MMAQHIDTFDTPKPLGADLTLAIISVGLIFIAIPLFAQTFPADSTTPTSPAMESTATPRSYVNPIIVPVPETAPLTGSSQSQRSADASQNNTRSNSQIQPLPECKVDDSVCIETRNKQNGINPQTAPASIR